MTDTVRTRFAPSPTGYLHVGGLRTALFNFLFARHHGGQFILRIEDTDRSRFVEGAAEKLMASLRWAGLEYDEGPDRPGDVGPYVQSERLSLYQAHVQRLIDGGHAYYCFCTAEELDAMRERQIAQGQPPRYDGTWRDRSEAEVRKNMEAGIPHVVRMKMPLDGETAFTDLVRGPVSFQNGLIDDQVIQKSDGYPTYHLANVVDDHYMGITHVIRGEEWLPSTPKHLQLYRMFGWEAPRMAHLSLLLNPDRSKLSKRQGDVAVEDYIEKGFLPEALVNFVALLGWSPGSEEEFFTLEELVEQFDIERVNKAGAVFDFDKLAWMNGNYIRRLPEDDLVAFLTPFLETGGADVSDPERTRKIIQAVYQGVEKGPDVVDRAALFFQDDMVITDEAALAHLEGGDVATVLTAFLDKVRALDSLDSETFRQTMKAVQKETGIKGAALWKPVRVAITGVESGPELPLVIDIFGKEKVCRVVETVLDRYVT